MFRLEFETSDAAFRDDAWDEIGSILRRLAKDIARGDMHPNGVRAVGQLRDINGNTIGRWQYDVD